MGRWAALAILIIPLGALFAGLTFGFEPFHRASGREGLATPPGTDRPQPRPEDGAKEEKPVDPEPQFAETELRLAEEGSVDEFSFVGVDEGIKVDRVSVTPLYEDIKVSEIKPLSVVFVIDNSLSMIDGPWGQGNDPNYERVRATEAALKELGDNDRAAIVTFPKLRGINARYRWMEPRPSVFSAFVAPRELVSMLENLKYREDGSTPLFAGAEMGFQILETEPDDRVKVMVLITDGRQEPEMMVPSTLLEAKAKSRAQVYGITLGSNVSLVQMRSFTDQIIQVSQASELVETFKTVIEKSVTQLTGYDIKMRLGREGEPFRSGEKVKVRAVVGGKPKILEVEVP